MKRWLLCLLPLAIVATIWSAAILQQSPAPTPDDDTARLRSLARLTELYIAANQGWVPASLSDLAAASTGWPDASASTFFVSRLDDDTAARRREQVAASPLVWQLMRQRIYSLHELSGRPIASLPQGDHAMSVRIDGSIIRR